MKLSAFPVTGSLPWLTSPYCYAGWIPTITGHLSFSLIGGAVVSPRCRSFNRPEATGSSRLVAVHQQRTAQDYIAPPGAVRLARPQASQDYVLVAQTWPAEIPYFQDHDLKLAENDQGVLFGNIIVIPRDRNAAIRRCRRALMADLRTLLDHQANPNVDPQAVINSICERLAEARLDGIACLAMDVALFRTGEVRIWFDLEKFLGRQIHPQAVPPSPEELELAELLAPQAYFFVKDITHFHYHHEPDSDQLLPLTRLAPVSQPSDHDKNELRWRRETLWGLARVVSQFRRKGTLYDFKAVVGVLAYADAFQSTLAMIWRRQQVDVPMESHDQLSRYDFAHTRSSVDALESLATWRKSGWLQFYAIMVGVMLSSLALWASVIQIRPIVCPNAGAASNDVAICPSFDHPQIVKAVVNISDNPVPFIGMALIFGFGMFILVIRDITFVPLGKPLQRLLNRVSKAVGATASRIVRRDNALADWLGWLSTLGVLGVAFALSVLIAAYRNPAGQWVANLIRQSLGH